MSTYSEKSTEPTGTPEAARPGERKPEKNVSIPLYVGGAAVQLSGLAAVAYQLSDPAFAYITMLMSLVGFGVSYYLRRVGTPSNFIKAGAVLLGIVFLYIVRGGGFLADLVPFEARGSQEMLIVCALAFTATFCAFLLVTDDAVVFTCVWAIAMIGLTGTVNINRELIFCFVAFLGAAAFLLVHQNSLANGMPSVTSLTGEEDEETGPVTRRFGRVRDAEARRTARWSLLRTQAMVALTCGITSLLLGFLIAIPMQMVGRNLSLASIIQKLNVPAAAQTRFSGASPQLTFDNLREFQVGLGPVADDPTERMRVQSAHPHYWRGRVYDHYTGRSWENEYADRNQWEELLPKGEPTRDNLNTFNIPPLKFERKKFELETHRFKLNSAALAPLYHAAEPKVMRVPTDRLVCRPDNTLGAPTAYGAEYEVDSEVDNAKPSELRKSSQKYSLEIRNSYIFDGANDEKLEALANRIIEEADAKNPYDKAESLRQWVSARCTYTLEARAVPPRRDAVDFFLNESREGYCDLYATALTMLCRYAGLPARVATGFAPGTIVENATPRTYVLRGSDLHAWTEVYFAGYGWIRFDATQDTPGTAPTIQTPEPVKREKTLWDRIIAAGWLPIVLTLAGFIGLLYFTIIEIQARASQLILPKSMGANGAAREVARTYLSAVRHLTPYGVRRTETMTTGDVLKATRETLGAEVASALIPLTEVTRKALYSQEPLTNDEIRAARQAASEFVAVLKRVPKPKAVQKPKAGTPVETSSVLKPHTGTPVESSEEKPVAADNAK